MHKSLILSNISMYFSEFFKIVKGRFCGMKNFKAQSQYPLKNV